MNLVAIDAGWNGAVAWMVRREGKRTIIRARRCPGDVHEMYRLLRNLVDRYRGEWRGIIEANHASPQFGARGNFGLGLNIGSWEGAFAAVDIPCEVINPRTWQKITSNTRSRSKKGTAARKEKAWRYARTMYPAFRGRLGDTPPSKTNWRQGIADALCILEYARRFYGQEA